MTIAPDLVFLQSRRGQISKSTRHRVVTVIGDLIRQIRTCPPARDNRILLLLEWEFVRSLMLT